MNLTELARILKVSPQDLRNLLPQIGFHIGQKAIKIDTPTAKKIIKEWPNLMARLERSTLAKTAEASAGENEEPIEKKKVKIAKFIIVKDFAAVAELPVSKILAELMKSGIFASMNEKIDFDTAAIIGADLNLEILPDASQDEKTEAEEENKLKNSLEKEEAENLKPRPPIIVVMGHVDHGKTKLLDAIRKTDVVAGEAGGITQHIGAYQITRKNKIITFIDTPGHEAFTAMRSRGAKVADIAILVVAADDGVKPQTIEAANIIKAAGIPFLVAMNKIDKAEADINKTKQELSTQLGINPEDWGGKIICAPISAKAGTGIEDLLDMVLLTADMEAKSMKANPESSAIGTVIESRVDKGEGPVATILIQNGTLKIGDQLCFNGQIYGKARCLKNYKGEAIEIAEPSTPVKIIGLKVAPKIGDTLESGDGEKMKKIKTGGRQTDAFKQMDAKDESKVKKVHIIIKSDMLGSAEAIEESLEKINTDYVKANIIHKGLGNITESDIDRAASSGAIIVGFHIKSSPQIDELAREKSVTVRNYKIIYDLINDIKERMQSLVEVEIKRVDTGRLKVIGIFRTENKSQIIGGKVIDGRIEADNFIEVIKDEEIAATGKLVKLQSGKQDVKTVEVDQECGIQYEGDPVIAVGDILKFYKEEKTIKQI